MRAPTKAAASRATGRMVPPGSLPVSPTREIGYTGLTTWSGIVTDEWERALAGTRKYRVYREMVDSDPICHALVWIMAMLLRQVQWTVQPAGEDSASLQAAEFLEQVLDDMETTVSQATASAATMFSYGFAPLEMVYKRRIGPDQKDPARWSQFTDGKIGIRKLALRGQETVQRWIYDPDGRDVLALEQLTRTGQRAIIPMDRIALFRTTTEKENPEGRSILRSAYRRYVFRKRLEEIEGIGIERELAGLPMITMPSSWLADDAGTEFVAARNRLLQLVKGIRRDSEEGILMPGDRDAGGNLIVELKLLTTGGTRQIQVDPVIQRYAREIATSVLADFIMLGQQKVGSFALSSDKTDLFATALGAYRDDMAAVWNRQVVPPLWRLNGLPWETMPTLVPGDLEQVDLAVLGDFLTALTGAGFVLGGDLDLENHLRKAAGMPLAPEDRDDEVDAGQPGDDGAADDDDPED